MDQWERKLATRDTNRVVRPFEWGTDWLNSLPFPSCPADANGNSAECVSRFVTETLADSDRFSPTSGAGLPVGAAHVHQPGTDPPPGEQHGPRTVVPGPKTKGGIYCRWNLTGRYVGRPSLNRCGISALRMTMAYHAERRPAETQRADYHVSSNVGRTIHAGRQSAVDVRACVDWLAAKGYSRIGVLGTSLGSCVAFMAAAHDTRIRMGIFNHVSMHFADVVWTGLSTQNVSTAFAGNVTQEELRRYWSVISPASYLKRFQGRGLKTLLIWASHDSTFLPVYSRQVLESFRELHLPHKVFNLPCGHYTTGQFPFNLLDGLVMCRFAARNL
jgi:hypothetical protein